MLLLLRLLVVVVVMVLLLHLMMAVLLLLVVQQLLLLRLLLVMMVVVVGLLVDGLHSHHFLRLGLYHLAAKLVDGHNVLAEVGRLDAGIGAVVAFVVLLLVVHEADMLGQIGHMFPALEANFPASPESKSTGLLAIE